MLSHKNLLEQRLGDLEEKAASIERQIKRSRKDILERERDLQMQIEWLATTRKAVLETNAEIAGLTKEAHDQEN